MTRGHLAFVLIAVVSFVSAPVAQQPPAPASPALPGPTAQYRPRPDFSGTWATIDSALTIRQDGSTLTVNDGTEARVYNLDGSDSRFSKDRSQYTARTRWVGSALVIATTTVSPIGTWEDLQVFSLDYGPKLNVVNVGSQTTQTVMYTETRTYAKR